MAYLNQPPAGSISNHFSRAYAAWGAQPAVLRGASPDRRARRAAKERPDVAACVWWECLQDADNRADAFLTSVVAEARAFAAAHCDTG
ncbi:hypothetical protein [Streptomyces sp. NPDC056682]|uniref:hypothetical protein n=1 Tax=Streptomyces sp. NPDC056682 TaxID=3345909 RepID=UPI0036C0C229